MNITTLRKILFTLVLLIPFIGCAQQQTESEMTVQELKEKWQSDSNYVLLDVRTEAELTGPLGHIPGIIHIPLQELDGRTAELEQYKDKTIAIICRSGNRSGVATKILQGKGFKAKNVLGGMIAWNRL